MKSIKVIKILMKVVDEQADDEGLWLIAHFASEAYLQQALRKLHHEIEKLAEDKKHGE